MSAPAAPFVAARPGRRPAFPAAGKRLLRDRTATAGAVLLAAVATVALLAPVLPLQPPDASHLALRLKPVLTPGHLLGTDQLGRDILSRLVWGTRLSLAIGVFAALVSSLVGSTIGLVAAYRGGLVDATLMRGIDTLMAFPYLLLALAIVAALGPGLFDAMMAIIVVNVPFFARGVRGAALSVVRADFMAAARLCGLSDARIVLSELLPNVMPGIVIGLSTAVGWMILETAGLSFLGLGAQPPQADLGGMLGEGRNLLGVAPHVATIPGLVILLLAVAINLLGDGLRDALDPKLKSGGTARTRARTDAAPAEDRRRGLPPPLALARLPLALRGLRTEFRVGRSVSAAVGGVDIAIAPAKRSASSANPARARPSRRCPSWASWPRRRAASSAARSCITARTWPRWACAAYRTCAAAASPACSRTPRRASTRSSRWASRWPRWCGVTPASAGPPRWPGPCACSATC